MNAPVGGGITVESVRVAPGSGALLRRGGSLLFVARVDESAAALIAAFVDAPDGEAIDAVTDSATVAAFDMPPFVALGWADRLHLVVFGPVEVTTDHPSLPMLSGAASASWVERRIRPGADTVIVRVGETADPTSDLQLGRVMADGFAATFTGTAPAVRPGERSHTTEPPSPVDPPPGAVPGLPEVPPPAPVPTTTATSGAATAPRPVADSTGPIGGDRLAALRAAMRAHDAAEVTEVDEPSTPDPTPVDLPTDDLPPVDTAPVDTAPVDDEITLAPHDPPDGDLSHPDPAHRSGDRLTDAQDSDGQAPFVAAIRCARGHANPTHVGVCQTCGDLLDIGAPHETIRQPPLATLELAGGGSIPIDRPLVVGRRPDLEAAQASGRALEIVIADDASVSRTHLRIDVEDWTLTVTDCGSRSGTAIVTRPGEEPRILEPWMAHELPIGSRLFLGGPSSVVVRPFTTDRGTRG